MIICCVNNKGGVGKTTFSCNLGVALARQEKNILVVDNDSQCNSSSILLPPKTIIRNSMYELLSDSISNKNEVSIDSCIYSSKYDGLYILPNVEETSGLDIALGSLYPKSLKFLRNKVRDYAKKKFDFTIIDCPPSLSIYVGFALHAADFVVVPLDAGSGHSLGGLRKALELIDSIQASGNPDLKFLRLLINRVDKRTSVGRVLIKDVTKRFGADQIFKTTIPINSPFQKAEYLNETIFNRSPTSKGATAYRNLAKEILSILNNYKR